MGIESAPTIAVLDVEGALGRLGGDRDLFLELTAMLLEDAPALFTALSAGMRAGDAAAVESKSHALKGLLLNCGGTRAARAAQLVEDAGHARRISSAAPLVADLETELDQLIEAIEDYRS